MNAAECFRTTIATPLGPMSAAFAGPVLVGLAFGDAPVGAQERAHAGAHEGARAGAQRGAPASAPAETAPALAALRGALEAYFSGRAVDFDIPLAPAGTPFQQAVWQALRGIPYGATASYAEIARRIGRPRAVRAVGLANARNPIAIIVPCHRVIGADGTLTGYAGGLERKQALLELESRAR
jgi:methylated-DNA-[protein]-cysteine S-methyltransferase